ncbi:hypothetical protein ACIRNI_22610 [Streptomyces sp. NPDC093546]|uniref:hypothetical protein n=1 Tax=Streptomyces sp. NPDC093546 TaxID=3366040 RepID=UPI00380527C6
MCEGQRRTSGGDCRDLPALAVNIRADAERRYGGAEHGWRAGVEWTLPWIEDTAGQLTAGRS